MATLPDVSISDAAHADGSTRPVALVTGASRGMGAATAVSLARAGYDVAIGARTVDESARPTERYGPPWARASTTSLSSVARRITYAGATPFPVALDLTDRASVAACADAVLERFGRCDVLCNIGIYQGPAADTLLLDTPIDEFANFLESGVVAPALLCQKLVPGMIERGQGTVINMSSFVVTNDPPGTVHDNGWSLAYAATKAGIDRFAPVLNVETAGTGVVSYCVDPGFVAYGPALAEAIEKFPGNPVSPPEAIGAGIVWLLQAPDAARLRNKRVYLPGLAHKFGLVPGWAGPGTMFDSAEG